MFTQIRNSNIVIISLTANILIYNLNVDLREEMHGNLWPF